MEKMYPNGPNESKTTYLLETRVYVQRGIDSTDDRKVLALFNALLPVSFLIVVLTIVIIIRKKSKLVFICFCVFLGGGGVKFNLYSLIHRSRRY